jgi:hypothetical protein
MQLKGCRRCGGDLYLAWDLAVGWFSACLQCGQDYYPRTLRPGERGRVSQARELVSLRN